MSSAIFVLTWIFIVIVAFVGMFVILCLLAAAVALIVALVRAIKEPKL